MNTQESNIAENIRKALQINNIASRYDASVSTVGRRIAVKIVVVHASDIDRARRQARRAIPSRMRALARVDVTAQG